MTHKPAPVSGIMGHVQDTEHVRQLERTYDVNLIGCSAKWQKRDTQYRVQIWQNEQWRGVFPMNAEDVEVYQ